MSTGSYNFTVYFALPRRDPLLLATVLSFMFTDFKRGLPSVEVHPTENQVRIKHIQVHFYIVMYNYFLSFALTQNVFSTLQFNYSKSFILNPEDSEVFINYVVG